MNSLVSQTQVSRMVTGNATAAYCRSFSKCKPSTWDANSAMSWLINLYL